MARFFSTLSLLLMATFVFSQSPVFQGTQVDLTENFKELEHQFYKSEIFQIDAQAFDAYVKSAGATVDFNLELGTSKQWSIAIHPRDIRGTNYTLRATAENGITSIPKQENLTYRGQVVAADGGSVSLTVDEDFIYGFFEIGEETYFIEPLWYFVPGQAKDLFVVYALADVKPTDGVCGADEMTDFMEKNDNHEGHDHGGDKKGGAENRMMGCKEVELSIASDFSMFQKYGSAGAVEAHNIGVINNVQTNWDDEFNDEIQFLIVEQFTVTQSGDDPWTTSTNAGTLLTSFRNWAPGGFSANHDLGELWTNRNLNNGVIGIAYVSAVCTSNRYHVLQDFSSNQNLLRVLTSHEIGHNFSAGHDAPNSGFIMAPSVNNTNLWSNASENSINNYYPTRFCLGNCATQQPPIVNFTVDPGVGCSPLTVTYMDQSIGATGWDWTFPGGTPNSSTDQNPVVTYSTPGSYDATLEASNAAGSNTLTQTNIVVVETGPVAAFGFTQAGLTIVFENNSINADEFLWDFGDNNTSTEENPIHTYAVDGFYDVTLTVTNECGPSEITLNLPVFTAPTAGFSASPTEGCASLDVEFTNQSSTNAIAFLWEFDGGTPETSNEENPLVTYTAPGIYTVSLTVTNPAGTDSETQIDYITVGTIPTPGFNFTVDGSTVTFDNTSDNSDGFGPMTYEWDFGDLTTNTEEDPVHTYTGNGDFEVTLTVTNDCGSSDITQTINIEVPPSAGFSASTTNGCEPLEVTFNNTSSSNATDFDWSFPGGTPNSSTEENPTITYNTPGTYDVTLIASNDAGADTIFFANYITVNALPTPGFTSSNNGPTYTFTNTSTDATSYSWDFGDMTTSAEENPVHTYTETGTFTVILTATNDCGSVTYTETVMPVTMPLAGFSADETDGCAPLTVQFNNESSENATSFEWDFPGGNPSSSTEENPVVTYDNPGTYSVTLTATNSAGSNTSTQTNYIVVNEGPSAGFNSTTNSFTVDFDNTSTNGNSYDWDFGDMGMSDEENPSHTYAEDGTYTVTLTVTNPCGTDTYTQTVVITSLPSAGFSANETNGCAPFTVQFNNESSENSTSFEWDFPGGDPSSSTEENPSVTYNSAGTYSVTLTAFNDLGESTVMEADYITVGAAPSANFSSTQNMLTVTFTSSSSNPVNSGNLSYDWDFGDMQSSNLENPVHTYAEDGTYDVELTVTNDCGSATFTQTITVVSLPSANFSASQTTGCEPFTVEFTNQSSENATSFEWQFPGGTPSTSTDENPTVTYNAAGVYSVTLTAINDAGEDETTQTDLIVVGAAPSANFFTTIDMLTVTFTNSSTNPLNSGGLTYDWDFGDTQGSNLENPVHTYADDGTYDVVLTVSNDCGSAMFTQSVTVGSQPNADFTASQTAGCEPLTVEFTNQSSDNSTSFEWDFPGGTPSTSTDENPTVTYNAAGVYSVTLTAINDAGEDEITQTDLIVVGAAPDASFSATQDLLTVTFTNSSTNPLNSGGLTYDWDFGDTQGSNLENPVHTYDTDGTYEVVLTVSNDCGSATFTGSVTVGSAPTANFSAQETSGCVPFIVEFMNTSSSNAGTYEWSFPGGTPSSSTEENPVVTYSAVGVYDVTLTVTNSFGTDTYEEISFITVDDVPTSDYNYMATDNTVTFTNNSTNATSYEWDFGDMTPPSNDVNATHTYAEDGAYNVVLTATNDCGSTTYEQIVVISVFGPVAAFTSKNNEGCVPLEVNFTNVSSDNSEDFAWSFPGGMPATSTEENPTVVYTMAGTYDVTLIASNGTGSDTYTETAYVIVGDVPLASFTFSEDVGTVTFTNTSTNSVNAGDMTYEWDFGDMNFSTDENPVHTYAEAGEYTVTLTAFNDCGLSSNSTTVIVMANSVGELPGISQFNVYPNPNHGEFTMILEGQGQPELEITFTNVLGQVLLNQRVDFQAGQLTKEFSFDYLAAGTYIFQVRSGDRALYKKVVVK